jgi:dienelactone hydrolase
MSSTTHSLESTPSPAAAPPRRRLRWLTSETRILRAALCGAADGTMLGTILAAMLSAYEQVLLPAPFHLLLFGFLGFALVSLGDGILSLLWKVLGTIFGRLKAERPLRFLRAVPPAHLGRLAAVLVVLYAGRLLPDSFFASLRLAAATGAVVWPLATAGALLAVARMPGRDQRTIAALLGAAGLVILLALGWLLYRGTDSYLARGELVPAAAVEPLDLPHPGLPGAYPVNSLTYGSGHDRQRDEFGAAADLTTTTVDGKPIFAGFSGLGGGVANWYWGFDYSQLPLNGRVWYPAGAGPFPLVLIVHGNHSMAHYSDPGYAYLAEHLASRGMIAVSVDQNFLNGFMLADGEGLEMPLRAWLLLKHLQQWRVWNETEGSPFYGRVDLDRMALIGHSRGGEAVAHAALLNEDLYRPVSQVAQPGEFGFGIRGVVGIAPPDGQFKPRGTDLTLADISYLMLVGGHDADTHTAMALPTYNRARYTRDSDAFAAMAYLYRANHGQFNTEWNGRDYNLFDSMLLNRRPYLSGEEQRQAAKVIITAFLEAVLNGQEGYRELFRAPHTAAAWLPDDLLVTAYKDGSFLPVDTSSRTGRSSQVDMSGASAAFTGFSDWQRLPLILRDGETSQGNVALRLTWEAGASPEYVLNLPPVTIRDWTLTADQALTLGLASAASEARPFEIWVELATAGGQAVRLPLSQFGAIHPPLPARILKAGWVEPLLGFDKISVETPFERVLQSYVLPLSAFVVVDPALQPVDLALIRFIFSGQQGGSVYIDDIGFLAYGLRS